jgi:hypothetical protein
MAEILGPLGICFGGISFVLGTVPATMRFAHDMRERKPQIRQCVEQFHRCQAKFNKWESHWRASTNEPKAAIIRSSLDDIVDLAKTIDRTIQRNTNTAYEKAAWEQMKNRLRQGDFYLPMPSIPDFCNKLRHALWKKSVLEGWISRREKAINIADESFQEFYQVQTAGHHKGSIDLKQATKLGELRRNFYNLACLGTDLYHECIATESYRISTHAWALGLRPPAEGNTIADWDTPTPLEIEVHFAVQKKAGDKYFHLRTCYKADQEQTHTTHGRIQCLVQAIAKAESTRISRHPEDTKPDCKKDPPNRAPQAVLTQEECLSGGEECHAHQGLARRSISIESIIKVKPRLLKNLPWLISLPELIYGITEWTLLLWKTPWLQNLSCSGLAIEMDTCSSACAKQVLEVPDSRTNTHANTFRLQNLGLVLAQLIIGVLIRPEDGSNLSRFEQYKDGEWKTVSLSDINMGVCVATNDLNLQKAVYFCLRPDQEISEERFEEGYLYICIDRIFEPFVLQSDPPCVWITNHITAYESGVLKTQKKKYV